MANQPADKKTGALELVAGVLHLQWPPGSVVGESDARAVMTKVGDLCSGRRLPLIVGMAGMKWVDHTARRVFADAWPLTRTAIVGASPVDEVMVRFYLARHSPACPTRYFTCFEEARLWLAGAGHAAETTRTPPHA